MKEDLQDRLEEEGIQMSRDMDQGQSLLLQHLDGGGQRTKSTDMLHGDIGQALTMNCTWAVVR